MCASLPKWSTVSKEETRVTWYANIKSGVHYKIFHSYMYKDFPRHRLKIVLDLGKVWTFCRFHQNWNFAYNVRIASLVSMNMYNCTVSKLQYFVTAIIEGDNIAHLLKEKLLDFRRSSQSHNYHCMYPQYMSSQAFHMSRRGDSLHLSPPAL